MSINETTEPSERLKSLRHLVGMNRAEASRKTGIPEITLRKWENNDLNINQQGAARCVASYIKLGVLSTTEWILTGEGKSPYRIETSHYNSINPYSFELLRQMQDVSADLFISFIDPEERFQLLNKKYETIFNVKAEEVYGQKLLDMIGEQGYKVCKPYIDRALAGEAVKFEYAWLQSNGEYMNLRLQYVPFISEQGQILGFFSYIQDLDSKKEEKLLKNDGLSAVLPILTIKNKRKFNLENYISCLKITRCELDNQGLDISDDHYIELSKHLYDYSTINQGVGLESYAKRIIEIAIKTNIF